MRAADQRTIAMIETEIELARTSYSVAISHSIAMDAALTAVVATFETAFDAATSADSEVDRTEEALQTLSKELAALQDR